MKKILAVILAVILSLSFAACNKESEGILEGTVFDLPEGWIAPENETVPENVLAECNNLLSKFPSDNGETYEVKKLIGIKEESDGSKGYIVECKMTIPDSDTVKEFHISLIFSSDGVLTSIEHDLKRSTGIMVNNIH